MPADSAIPYYLEKPDAPSSGFSDIAQAAAPDLSTRIQSNEREMGLARDKQARAREDERAAMETRAAALKPQIASVEQAMGQREQLAANRPPPLDLPPPPPRKLTDFLAPVEGEQPENTISKLLQGVGLLASGFTGLRRGNASTALASMAGALKGWHEGDKERADRHYADWRSAVDTMIAEQRSLNKSYQDIMDDASLTVDQRMEMLRLKSIDAGHDVALATFDRRNAEEDVRDITERRKQLEAIEKDLRHADQQKAIKDEEHAIKREAASEKIREFSLRLAQQREKTQGGLDPAAIEMYAQQVAGGGPMPYLGMGQSQGRIDIANRAAKIRDERGDPAGALGIAKASYDANKQELASIQRQRGLVLSFAENFDLNLKVAMELSEKADRSGNTVFNKWLNAGRKATGDVDVARFNAAVLTVVNEYAKVTSGSTQGSDTSRAEAAQMLNTALTPEQFRGVAQILQQDTHNRARGYQQRIDAVKQDMDASKAKPTPTMLIRRFADGKWQYAEGPEGAVPPGWEKAPSGTK